MPIGPGKYDDICTEAMKKLNADGTILVVFNGELGSGFSAVGNIETLMNIPEVLRDIASKMEHDITMFGGGTN